MKRVCCLLLIALCLLGCVRDTDAPVVLVPSPEAPHTAVPTAAATDTPAPTEAITEEPTAAPTPTPEPTAEDRLRAYIAAMPVEDKIGQLCMFGFSGTKTISSEFKTILQTYRIGSVILYGQNIARTNSDGGFTQCRALSDSVREASRSEIPLLISTDVEGGSVTRFKWKKTLLSARSLGTKNDPERAEERAGGQLPRQAHHLRGQGCCGADRACVHRRSARGRLPFDRQAFSGTRRDEHRLARRDAGGEKIAGRALAL